MKVPNPRTGPRQALLFRLEDPLTARFGAGFFAALPEQPGVYFFTGEAGRLLYIGQSANLRARVGSYRHVTMGRHPRRSLRLVAAVRQIEWECCESVSAAIGRERELLLERRPPFNRAGVWIGPPWWLTGEIESGVLRLRLSREPQEQAIGPLPSSFRYLLGTLARCVQRALAPEMPFHAYPHGLTRPATPLCLHVAASDPEQAWHLIIAAAGGETTPLLAMLDALPETIPPGLAEFWTEERERLEAHGAKPPKATISEGLALQRAGNTTMELRF